MASDYCAPSSILIVGSGVFGLSTAFSLSKDPKFKDTSITLVDRQPFPAPDGSSIDTSRIIRPDYACSPYTALVSRAQALWRTTFAAAHYHENGLCITASGPSQTYVSSSLSNVRELGTCKIEELHNAQDIERVTGVENASGAMGYVNWSSGWADAEGAMRWLRREVEALTRVTFVTGTVDQLLFDHDSSTVSGALLKDKSTLTADLTILAAGAWTPSLLDLRGIAKATGQVLAYMPVSAAEEARLRDRLTLLNLSTGMFLIPPSQGLLKVARHGHGYVNPTTIRHPESPSSLPPITVSLPLTHIDSPGQSVPAEGLKACREFLSHIHPSLCVPSRPFTKSKICWYTDTQHGDFLIDYHPKWKGLFVATGGAGHAFKFLPVIGDAIVQCVVGRMPDEFKGRWEWPAERVEESMWEGDGSRGGPVGMVLSEEIAKGGAKL
ncbi:sarcosine oxidase [Polyplosphaeria fusca]|uniref:Sarcosine oxidase n=1 Tax=Polyplosphaeria fusca TaxID=682080 RepID=A0A9P4QVC0_9PLEO|nr:sarcosine oxidase [Polyplosphaeria fusca]